MYAVAVNGSPTYAILNPLTGELITRPQFSEQWPRHNHVPMRESALRGAWRDNGGGGSDGDDDGYADDCNSDSSRSCVVAAPSGRSARREAPRASPVAHADAARTPTSARPYAGPATPSLARPKRETPRAALFEARSSERRAASERSRGAERSPFGPLLVVRSPTETVSPSPSAEVATPKAPAPPTPAESMPVWSAAPAEMQSPATNAWQVRLLELLASPAPQHDAPPDPRRRRWSSDASVASSDSDDEPRAQAGAGPSAGFGSTLTGPMDAALSRLGWAVDSAGRGGSAAIVALRRWRHALVWQTFANWRRARHWRLAQLEQVARRWASAHIGAALRTWAATAVERRGQLDKLRAAVGALRRPQLASGLRAWIEFDEEARARAALIRASLHRLIGQGQLACLRRWRAHARLDHSRARACDLHAERARRIDSFYGWKASMHEARLAVACVREARGAGRFGLRARPPSTAEIRAAGVDPANVYAEGPRVWPTSPHAAGATPADWAARAARDHEARDFEQYAEQSRRAERTLALGDAGAAVDYSRYIDDESSLYS